MPTLTDMLLQGAPLDELASLLDGLDHAGRWGHLSTLNRKEQRLLWKAAAAAAPITLEHFAPPSRARLTEINHQGRNSLPLPGAFRDFQKLMCRPAEGDDTVLGFNEGASRPLIGPGYFVAHTTEGNADWEQRGAVVVDYFMVPDGPVVEGWPTVKRNNQGLQILVFHQTRDFMRKVSEHVSVGAAYKKEKALDQYFVLCREDPA